MTKVLITESYLEDIADSIRAKNGTENTYKPSEMASAIDDISGGGTTPTGTKEISITQNGTTTEDVTNYASAEITVNVSSSSPTLQTKTVTPSESTQNVSADNGYDGLSQVTVNPIPSSYVQPSGTLNITSNDTYDVSQYASAVVNVSGGGGGSHSTETYYLKFNPSTELSNTNKLSLQLNASENCFVFVHAVTRPSPPASGYKALFWAYSIYRFNASYVYSNACHAILRANDTIGSDATQCDFAPSTGVLQLGGQYGHFFPEDEYEVIQIVFD